MYQPMTVQCSLRWLYIQRHDACDYCERAPFWERINPLRYEIVLFPPRGLALNKGAKWQRRWANLNWYLWKRRWRSFTGHMY